MILVLMSIASFTTYADQFPPSCIREKWTLLQEVSTPTNCVITKELNLQEGLFDYPFINVGLIKVRYWQAEMTNDITVNKIYRHEYINVCSGNVTYATDENFTEHYHSTSTLSNPNLDKSITESFKLSPMTSDEANKAWQVLKNQCNL